MGVIEEKYLSLHVAAHDKMNGFRCIHIPSREIAEGPRTHHSSDAEVIAGSSLFYYILFKYAYVCDSEYPCVHIT